MKAKLLHSLQFKIFVITLLIVFIPLVVLGYVYYAVSTESITDNLQKTDENAVNQVSENIRFIFDDTHDLSLFFVQSEQAQALLNPRQALAEEEVYENQRSVEQLLLHLIGSKDYYASIQIEDMDDLLVNTTSFAGKLNRETKETLMDLNGKGLVMTNPETQSISYARLVKNIYNVSEALGYITIDLAPDYIAELFESKQVFNTDHYYLVDKAGNVLVDVEESDFSADEMAVILAQTKQEVDDSQIIKLHKQKYIRTTKEIADTGLSIVHVVSLEELMGGKKVFSTLVIVAFLVSMVICTLAAFQFSRYIVRPIIHLQALMEEVDDGKFDVRFKPRGNNEIDLLGKAFNSMLYRTNFLIKLVYSAEIRKKDAEIKALYTQINPHFLYNTLDSIYWMGQMENAPKSAKMTHALAKLFRIMLHDQKDTTTVAMEVEYVAHYLEIQKMRYEEMIAMHVEVAPETNQAKTIKLVLQPLIENAITHGIEPKADGGTIYIQTRKVDDMLEIVVEDDGIGADVDKLNQQIYTVDEDNDSIALRNIHERISIRDGADYGLTFSNSEKGGLKVTVHQKWEVA